MEEETLKKADIKIIQLIKNEQEKLFNSITDVDNSLTNKCSNLLNVCISIATLSIGYSISKLMNNDFSGLTVYSIFISIIFLIVIFKLFKVISPTSIALLGSDKLIQNNLISGSEHDEYLILTNRILNIKKDIISNEKVAKSKSKIYKESYKFLVFGLISISFLFFLFCLFLNGY